MATARKLPSGKWRVLVFDGMVDGKKKYKSITGDTKGDAEMKARQYLNDPSRKAGSSDVTVKDAIERYISSKTNVLSPATIRGYRQMQRTRYDSINDVSIYKLDSEKMQKYISSISADASAKSVSNAYGLLSSSVAMFRPDAVFRITLPKKARKRQNAPSDGDVQKLYESANEKLRICIALAAFGSMRRGEICALKHGDVNGCCISVHADMVANEDNKFEYKDMPKTSDSIRDVLLPQNVIDMLGTGEPDDFIFSFNPNWITKNFILLRNSVGISIRFHDLRHYYASIGAALNIPDIYTARFGGWRPNSPVMKEVYQNNMQAAEMLYSEKMNAHFSSIIKENE